MMYKKGHGNLTGNDRFEGYCVDLIQELSTILDFKYELYLVHDNRFGARRPDGHWDGMVGEVLAGVSFKIPVFFLSILLFDFQYWKNNRRKERGERNFFTDFTNGEKFIR